MSLDFIKPQLASQLITLLRVQGRSMKSSMMDIARSSLSSAAVLWAYRYAVPPSSRHSLCLWGQAY
jgi:hypothetical protein